MDSYNDSGDGSVPCCLDCRFRELRGELYGGTSYWCALKEMPVESARVLQRACDEFERFGA